MFTHSLTNPAPSPLEGAGWGEGKKRAGTQAGPYKCDYDVGADLRVCPWLWGSVGANLCVRRDIIIIKE